MHRKKEWMPDTATQYRLANYSSWCYIYIKRKGDIVRVFKTKWFARYARRVRIEDRCLCEAVERMECGNVDADLGGGIIKQRIARPGHGRSGGYRLLVAYRAGDRAVFLYGFAKSERDNIYVDELTTLRDIAAGFLKANDKQIEQSIQMGVLQEVRYGNEKE